MNRSCHLAALVFGLAITLLAVPTLDAQRRPRNTNNNRNNRNNQTQPAPPPADTTPTPMLPPPIPPAPVNPVVTLPYDTADGGKSSVNANRDALAVLALTLNAYDDLKGLDITGTASTETGSTGKLLKTASKFALTWSGPNFYKAENHQDDAHANLLLQAGSNGKEIYSYDKPHETYTTAAAPADRYDPNADPATAQIFHDSVDAVGLPVVFVMAKDPKMATIRLLQATKIELAADAPAGDTTCHAIKFTQPTGTTTLLIDPKTHLVARVESSETDPAKPDTLVNRTYDYLSTATNADLDAANFAWTPPATAKPAAPPVTEILGTPAAP